MKITDFDAVIWDYNGTILDDVEIGIRAVNELLSARGLPVIPDAEAYRRVFGFPVEDYYRRIGLPVETEGYDKLAHEWVAAFRRLESETRIRDGVLETLMRIRSLGIRQYVLSVTEENMLKEQIRPFGIADYFTEICGTRDIFARSKEAIALSLAERLAGQRVLLIGDTLHDAAVARAAGFSVALVGGGHATDESLSAGCENFFPSVIALREALL